jgi:hypothetical protein
MGNVIQGSRSIVYETNIESAQLFGNEMSSRHKRRLDHLHASPYWSRAHWTGSD